MFYTIALVLIILWLLGLVSVFSIGGLIHTLLGLAVLIALLRLISDRRI